MHVEKWMTDEVVTVRSEEDAETAWNKLVLHNVRQVPVVNQGTLEGIVSRTDVLQAFQKGDQSESTAGHSVRDIMTSDPLIVEPRSPIEEAASVLYKNRISALPVVRDGELVGILSKTDVFRAVTEMSGMREETRRVEFEKNDLGECFFELLDRTEVNDPTSVLAFQNEDQTGWTCLVRYRNGEEEGLEE